MALIEKLEKLCEECPVVGGKLSYGTAGFRTKASEMKHVVQRCGILMTLRSYMKGCKAVGCMITASHNPVADNGIKMIDPTGEMLASDFELYAQVMVGCGNPATYVSKICREMNIADAAEDVFSHTTVLVGRDTRESSAELSQLLIKGVEAMGGKAIDFGVVTTPELHFLVARANSADREAGEKIEEDEYFNIVASHFMDFVQATDLNAEKQEKIIIDGSNGVGALKFGLLDAAFGVLGLTCEIRNTGKELLDVLNEECGAEYVQKNARHPRLFDLNEIKGVRCVSVDGDADRLVYFTANEEGKFELFDGDKIACLFKHTVGKMMENIDKAFPNESEKKLHMVIVQTAYTNNAATKAIIDVPLDAKDVSFDYAQVKTGVKNLHKKSVEYDVGLYFEVNGHGTVVVDFEKMDEWAASKGCKDSDEYRIVKAFLKIFNQETGDAMTNVLAVEASLRYLNMTIDEWAKMYTANAVVNRKMPLARSKLKQLHCAADNEAQLARPPDLQKDISAVIGENERAFLRPSGTEDVARIYAEAQTLEAAGALADKIENLVRKYFPDRI
eukprot:Selendium_serpulae@DN5226_c0_g1_i1.p1